jgi:hypothetical protein
MKYSFLAFITFISIALSSVGSCTKEATKPTENNNNTMTTTKIKIKVNAKTFTASLNDNESAKAFMDMLPLTINMTELNGNEKYYDFNESLPTNSSNPGSIQNGDLKLYGSKTLVLFYKSFSTSYSYTKLGSVDDATGLASALGSGNVTVTYELE